MHQLLLIMKSIDPGIDHDPGPDITWYCIETKRYGIDLLFYSPIRKQMNTYGNVELFLSDMCLLCLTFTNLEV